MFLKTFQTAFKYVFRPKILLIFGSCFFYLPMNGQTKKITLNPQKGCMNYLVKKYLRPKGKKMVDTDQEELYLSIKTDCQESKADAAECCSNPKSCSGLILDIFKHATPVLPSLYSAYKGYKTSDKLGSGELTHEEARAKTCDIHNKTAMGGYLGSLLSQLTPLVESSCGDDIDDCKEECNDYINRFEKDFFNCFNRAIPEKYNPNKTGLGRIITFAKECASQKEIDDIEIDIKLTDTKSTEPYTCHLQDDGSIVNVDKQNINNSHHVVEHILLLTKAYANSSAIKDQKLDLSSRSDESEVVACSKQVGRTASTRTGPGPPVSNPALKLCEPIVDQLPKNPPPLPNPTIPGPDTTAGFATGRSTLGSTKKPNLLLLPPDDGPLGVIDTDDLPDDPNKPKLNNNPPRWAASTGSNNGPGGGPGGGLPSGGGPSLPSEDSDYDYPYSRGSGDITGSFSGGDFFPGAPGGSSSDSPSYDRDSAEGDGEPQDMAFSDTEDFPDEEEETSNEGSIFHLASQRIQQFCADHQCIK